MNNDNQEQGHEPKIVVQLNRPALDRLLAGDSEMEVQLRHQIVQEFTKHSLLPITKTQEYTNFCRAIHAEVCSQWRQLIANSTKVVVNDQGQNWVLQDLITEYIRDRVKKEIDARIAAELDLRTKHYMSDFTSLIERRVREGINTVTKEELKKQAEEYVQRVALAIAEVKKTFSSL